MKWFPPGDVARVAVFAALIAVLGLAPGLYVFGGAVPVTLQTFGVMLAGLLLGSRRAALAVAVLIALVAVGLPLLAGGRGGLAVLASPTAGYLLGWLPGAFVTGWIAERGGPGGRAPGLVRLLVACLVGGMGIVYLCGIPVYAIAGGLSLGEAALFTLAFVPGDLAKAVLAAVVARGVQRAYPGAIPAVHAARPRSSEED
ncbi:biotin transporter BioY [Nonomuraea sp. MCN248]|uniref:Biotin transporter n=1 Tax=Nonomuraea corallina TaxID=2989783 RepID=A0ABT4SL40_9ACTN|nr:biotin transporter BioY [Nonomuraea corallina]MDA0637951.1 biotin transporter BioY [Nonomuraea corallina]